MGRVSRGCAQQGIEAIISGHPVWRGEAVFHNQEGAPAAGFVPESFLHALACGTEDKKEGVTAFLERCDSRFRGKQACGFCSSPYLRFTGFRSGSLPFPEVWKAKERK